MNIHWTKAEVGTTGFTYVLSDTIDSNLDNFFEFCRPSRKEQGQQSFNSKFYMCQSPVFTQGIYKISTKSMVKIKRLPRYKEKIKLLARNKNKYLRQNTPFFLSSLLLFGVLFSCLQNHRQSSLCHRVLSRVGFRPSKKYTSWKIKINNILSTFDVSCFIFFPCAVSFLVCFAQCVG